MHRGDGLTLADLFGYGVEDAAYGGEILGVGYVDQVMADALDVVGGGFLEEGETVVGEFGEDAPLVALAGRAADQFGRLEAADGVGEAGAALVQPFGQVGHPQPPVGCLGQPDQDLVVVQPQPEPPQVVVQLRHQPGGAEQIGTPGDLLLRGQPAGTGRRRH